jgi:hypothetical protein
MATFVVSGIDPLYQKGPLTLQPKPTRPMIIRQKLGESAESCRKHSRKLVAVTSPLTEQEMADLERGHQRLDQIPIGKLHSHATVLGASVVIALGDSQVGASYADKTLLGHIIRKGAGITLSKGN